MSEGVKEVKAQELQNGMNVEYYPSQVISKSLKWRRQTRGPLSGDVVTVTDLGVMVAIEVTPGRKVAVLRDTMIKVLHQQRELFPQSHVGKPEIYNGRSLE